MDTGTLPVAALAWTLLHFLWQGGLIGGTYALLRNVPATPQGRLLIGQLSLLAMALAPVATFVLLLSASQPASGSASPALSVETVIPLAMAHGNAGFTWLAGLVALWAAGAILLSLRAGLRWLAVRRICRMAVPAPAALQSLVDGMARQLGVTRPVVLRLCQRLKTPVLVGFWRPVILIPAALAARIPLRQLELLVAHELAHVQRWDFLANLMQSALEIVLYYHPLVHWVSARVRQDREECCDDLVARQFGNPVQYARALLAAAEAGAEPEDVPHFALAATGGVLMPRIERLLNLNPEQHRRPAHHRAVLACLMLALLCLGLASAFRAAQVPGPLDLDPLTRAEVLDGLPGVGPALAAVSLLLPQLDVLEPEFEPANDETVSPVGPLPVRAIEPQFLDAPLGREALASLQPQTTRVEPPTSFRPAAADELPPGPALLRYQSPEYPASAQARGVEGEVLMGFRILADGRVTDIEAISVSPPGEASFVQAARQALRNWRFERVPGGLEGQVRSFQFRLTDAEVTPRCLVQTGTRMCRNGD